MKHSNFKASIKVMQLANKLWGHTSKANLLPSMRASMFNTVA